MTAPSAGPVLALEPAHCHDLTAFGDLHGRAVLLKVPLPGDALEAIETAAVDDFVTLAPLAEHHAALAAYIDAARTLTEAGAVLQNMPSASLAELEKRLPSLRRLGPIGKFPLSDAGNAERFAAIYGTETRFCAKSWRDYTGVRWTETPAGKTEQRTLTAMRAFGAIAERQDEVFQETIETFETLLGKSSDVDPGLQEVVKRLKKNAGAAVKHALASEAEPRLRATLRIAGTLPGIACEPDTFDQHPWLLNCPNGIVDLKARTFTPRCDAHRELYLTTATNADFDPQAKCPKFDHFMNEIMGGDPELVSYTQRVFGSALVGETVDNALFLMVGNTGNNGKSTFLLLLQEILGAYAHQAPAEMLLEGDRHPTELMDLKGVRLALCVEPPKNLAMDEARVKQLTGGDTMKGRRMGKDWQSWKPTHTPFIAANHVPRINGTDGGIWRRIHIIPFEVEIPAERIIKDLRQQIFAEEAAGVLTWLVQGCIAWQKVGLAPPARCQLEVDEERSAADVVGLFIEEEVDFDPTFRVPGNALYQHYVAWCDRSGNTLLKRRSFSLEIKRHGISKVKTMGAITQTGCRIRITVPAQALADNVTVIGTAPPKRDPKPPKE